MLSNFAFRSASLHNRIGVDNLNNSFNIILNRLKMGRVGTLPTGPQATCHNLQTPKPARSHVRFSRRMPFVPRQRLMHSLHDSHMCSGGGGGGGRVSNGGMMGASYRQSAGVWEVALLATELELYLSADASSTIIMAGGSYSGVLYDPALNIREVTEL